MKKLIILLALLVVGSFAFAEEAKMIKLSHPVVLKLEDGTVIDTDPTHFGYASVNYRDFDGDGVKDLLSGEFEGGVLRFYKNYGTDTAPIFRDFELVKDTEGNVIFADPG